MKQFLKLLFLATLAFSLYLIKPMELSVEAWNLFIIFLITIFSVMLQVSTLAVASLGGLIFAVFTNTMSFQTGFSSFGEPIVWLILSAFFVSFGIIKSGLSTRLAFYLLRKFGSSLTGITYAISITELILGLIIPSATARTGGIIFPIISEMGKNSSKYFNQYITYALFVSSCISSAAFLTAMAGNALIMKFAAPFGAKINWSIWFLGASVPTAVCILLLPFILKMILKKTEGNVDIPSIKRTTSSLTSIEVKTILIIMFLLLGWVLGPLFKVSAAVVSLIGVMFLIIFKVITWEELKSLGSAWDSFIWFSALLSMASNLNNLGVTNWIGAQISILLANVSPISGIIILALSYFYLHYFFASSTAHISALLLPFAIAMMKFNLNPLVTFLSLGYLSNLCACLTHYGNGPAPILFSSKVLTIRQWWIKGFLISIFFMAAWFGTAVLWWRILKFI